MNISGATRICQVIGHPIGQVRSPDLFNARAEQLGADVVLIPVDVSPEQLGDFIAFSRGWNNSAGFCVTVPHKRAVVRHLDLLTDRARRLQAVNVVRREPDGRLIGDMVDGTGFLAATTTHGFTAAGRSGLVIGTGGAGSAIVDALCEAGIARLALHDLKPGRVSELRALFTAAFPSVEIVDSYDGLDAFDLVVNASPAGMGGMGELPILEHSLAGLRPETLVADVVTSPPVTSFLLAAQARGCKIQTGVEMAAGQIGLLAGFMQALPETIG